MQIKQRALLVLAGAIFVGGILTGCQEDEVVPEVTAISTEKAENESQVESDIEAIALSDWEGAWNNMGAYLDDEELQGAFEELAAREELSKADVKKAYEERRHVDFDGLVIEQNTVILLDGFKDDGGVVIEEAEYEYKATLTVKHGNFDTKWYHFEAVGDAKYKTILMMPVHGEELLTHFHLRYGNDLDELLAMEDWYPTFVKPGSTYDQLHGEITE